MEQVKKNKKSMIEKILEIDSYYRKDDVKEDIFKLKNIKIFNSSTIKKWNYSCPTLININIKQVEYYRENKNT